MADQVLASTADTMRQTIEYVISTWGSAQGYAKDALSLSAEEISAIRVNVMVQAEPSGMPLLAGQLDQEHGRAMLCWCHACRQAGSRGPVSCEASLCHRPSGHTLLFGSRGAPQTSLCLCSADLLNRMSVTGKLERRSKSKLGRGNSADYSKRMSEAGGPGRLRCSEPGGSGRALQGSASGLPASPSSRQSEPGRAGQPVCRSAAGGAAAHTLQSPAGLALQGNCSRQMLLEPEGRQPATSAVVPVPEAGQAATAPTGDVLAGRQPALVDVDGARQPGASTAPAAHELGGDAIPPKLTKGSHDSSHSRKESPSSQTPNGREL